MYSGEERIVSLEQIGRDGVGVAKLKGVSILINKQPPEIRLWLELRTSDAPMRLLKSVVSEVTI